MTARPRQVRRRATWLGLGVFTVVLGCSSKEDGAEGTANGGASGLGAVATGGSSTVGNQGGGAATSGTAGDSGSGTGGSAPGGNGSAAAGASGSDGGGGASAGAPAGGSTTQSSGGSGPAAGAGGDEAGKAGDSGGTGAGAPSGGGTAGGRAGSGNTGGEGSGGATPSAGCTKTAPASGRYTLDVSGTAREYILKVPAGYEPARPYPLILAWHGRMYSADWVANGDPPQTGPYFGVEAEANGSAIFVAPQALSSGWSNQGGRDVAFALAMLERFDGELCVDQGRVHSIGFSFGAIMTLALGCGESDLFRAVAPMSGSLQNGCPDGGPVAYWSSHGTQDTTIPIANGEAARDEFVERNGCSSQTLPTDRAGCVAYQGCDPGYPVVWCTFDGAHVPPDFAGPELWRFLSQF